jgi:transposase
VIGPTGQVRVLVATKPVDFRKGMDGLAALVKEQLHADPFSGMVYVFRAKRADRVKLIWWNGTGLCFFAKRLEEGPFRWPKVEDGVMRLATLASCGERGHFPAEHSRQGALGRTRFTAVPDVDWARQITPIRSRYLIRSRAFG